MGDQVPDGNLTLLLHQTSMVIIPHHCPANSAQMKQQRPESNKIARARFKNDSQGQMLALE